MELPLLRVLIQEKLADGRLPRDHFPRIRSGRAMASAATAAGDRDRRPDRDGES